MKKFYTIIAVSVCMFAKMFGMQPVPTPQEEVFIMQHPTGPVQAPEYIKPGMSAENRKIYEKYKQAHAQWVDEGRLGPEPKLIWIH